MASEGLLSVVDVTKDFPGVRALDRVNLAVRAKTIHCVCGENGAGKSTLMGVVSGAYPHGSFEGTIAVGGVGARFRNIADSQRAGLAVIHQELMLSPYLSIAENMFLGRFPGRFGFVDRVAMIKKAAQMMVRVGLHEDPLTPVNLLSVGRQQLVEIARALTAQARLIILDEPTASLNDEESLRLLQLLLELKDSGVTAVMITHKLAEVAQVADEVTIMRDGQTVASYPRGSFDQELIIRDMVGRALPQRFPKRECQIGGDYLEVKDWTVYHPTRVHKPVVRGVSLKVKRGEVVGLCGLMGSGRTELMMSIFGGSYGSHTEGKIFVDGKPVEMPSPKAALRMGLCYASEDRKALGLILQQDLLCNITNSNLERCSRAGVIDFFEVQRAGKYYWQALRIKTPNLLVRVRNLSGGNQQKVVLSRCLYAQPDVLIIDEPTRGIDVGARYEIYQIINSLACEGKCIIMISSEMEEILGMADRIYVMHEGMLKGELSRGEATQEKIMKLALQ